MTTRRLPYDAKRVMNALAGVNSKYNRPSKVTVEATEKGNWYVYYNNQHIGLTLKGSMLSEETIRELNWEYHEN